MPKLLRLTPQDAESLLLKAGFVMARSRGSHRIFIKGNNRVVVPFHSGQILHPKIVRQVLNAIDNS